MLQIIPELVEVEGRKKVKITIHRRPGHSRRRFDQSVSRHAPPQSLHASGRPLRPSATGWRHRRGHPAIHRRKWSTKPAEPKVDLPLGEATLARSEMIMTSALSALSIPETVLRDGAPGGRWRLYSAFQGRRGVIDLPVKLEQGNDVFWIHPFPSDPAPATPPGWSAASRRDWLEKTEAPDTPHDLFDDLCETLDAYLEFGSAPEGQTYPPQIMTLALWTMLTYVYSAWDAVPYLYVNGPAGQRQNPRV